ncbi:hypothetical protein MNBD_GAMMA07-1978 [hydrothermal vent metagenome]|uniref:Uncharacterized protein n=1 Tax=hydrothermal vent metagenome TaxID=652676 RepID=A0A3B0WDG2_9ZZZZ
MIFSFNRKSAVFFIALFLSAQASAITVYDVIQLSDKAYSDDNIIALIKNTNSAFELKADDVSRLVELGINEPIIQAMLKATPPAKENSNIGTTTPAPESTKHAHNKATSTTSDLRITWSNIHAVPLDESASGGHHHQAIAFSNIQLFILRDRGRLPSLARRAKVVTNQLIKVSGLSGAFNTGHNGVHDTIIFTDYETLKDVIILEVTPRDAKTYQRRSQRKVTSKLLAAYWSSLLTDYWALTFDNQAPEQLVTLNKGKALLKLYQGIDQSIKGNAEKLAQSFLQLDKQDQKNLKQLAATVPSDFNIRKKNHP